MHCNPGGGDLDGGKVGGEGGITRGSAYTFSLKAFFSMDIASSDCRQSTGQ